MDAGKKLYDVLNAGGEPTTLELTAALEQALHERSALEAITRDMGTWLAKLAACHISRDGMALGATLDEYIAKHIKTVYSPVQSGQVH
jgi:hypothetical protein